MHYVSKVSPTVANVPEAYATHSAGFRRAAFVDPLMGSVHLGAGLCYLSPGGEIRPHVHAFEESFFLLDGHLGISLGERNFVLGPGHFGLIATGTAHAWRNLGGPAIWLEMQSPQPRPRTSGRDTFFVPGSVPQTAGAPAPGEPGLGHFDENQFSDSDRPAPMEGAGIVKRMLVDSAFGAVHHSVSGIQFLPGAKLDPHDHPFEETCFIVSGGVRAVADDQTYDLAAGDVIWSGVGCVHSLENVGIVPARWIETRAPLPPAKEGVRFEREWEKLAASDPA